MISYQQAMEHIHNNAFTLAEETVPLQQSLGGICSQDVICSSYLPPFNNSAMDGFALQSHLTEAASEQSPLQLKKSATITAGDENIDHLNADHCCVAIMTGAPVPDIFDGVIPIERVQNNPDNILINSRVEKHANIRFKGEDLQPGDIICNKNQPISPQRIMVMANAGIQHISIRKTPSIGVIATGSELTDDASQALKPHQIRNCNTPYIISQLQSHGYSASYGGIIKDELTITEQAIEKLKNQGQQIIISTGAVSMGQKDFIPEVLAKLGAEIIFHKVAIRPGKPILFAKWPDNTYYFGLPGNPISAALGLRLFVIPLLHKLQNLPQEQTFSAQLANSGKKKAGFRFFLKSHLYADSTGQLQVQILSGQQSFKTASFGPANAWAIIPEDIEQYTEKDMIEVLPLQNLPFDKHPINI